MLFRSGECRLFQAANAAGTTSGSGKCTCESCRGSPCSPRAEAPEAGLGNILSLRLPSRPRERGTSLVTRRWRMRFPPTALDASHNHQMRQWFNSRTRGCQSRDPGAIPGRRSRPNATGTTWQRPQGRSGSNPEANAQAFVNVSAKFVGL